jgi:hypothetical protein
LFHARTTNHAPEAIQKNCAIRGGFQAAFPLYQMNRHKQPTPEKTKTESKERKTHAN